MHAVILAGGLGTRLRALVPDMPKPMAPVAGRPFLEHLLRQLRRNGFADVMLCVGYRAEVVRDHFGDGAALEMHLRYSIEPEPLGTAGALRLAGSQLTGERWLVLNGDSYFGIPFPALVAAHATAGGIATLALRRVPDTSRYGRVELETGGRISRFVEKAVPPAGAGLINGGVYVVERSLLDQIPTDRPVSLESEVLPQLAGAGLHGVEFDAPFVDIGAPGDYVRLRDEPASVIADLL